MVSEKRAAEIAHFEKYGSILFCPERKTICSFMDGAQATGCQRKPCILDDPADIELQRRIRETRARQEETLRKQREEEKTAAPVRDQRNMIKTYVQKELEKVREIEEQSQEAYRRNDPRTGDTLFNRARIRRGELRKYMIEKGLDPQSI